ncbi:hypothetical protein DFH29DRAFT_908002 [Suillus ampliporus]|nr:hypothetical protein DFH29DRAFT_908002 [Suillus ampliporus]
MEHSKKVVLLVEYMNGRLVVFISLCRIARASVWRFLAGTVQVQSWLLSGKTLKSIIAAIADLLTFVPCRRDVIS